MTTPKLSQALSDIGELLAQVEDLEGEDIPDELVPKWHVATGNLKDAIDNRAFHLRQISALQLTLDVMIKNLQRKKKNFARYEERMLALTKYAMEQNPQLEFKGDTNTFWIATNPSRPVKYNVTFHKPPVIVDPFDVPKFPTEFMTAAQMFVLDKDRFEDALRAERVTCEGAELGERGTHVRYR